MVLQIRADAGQRVRDRHARGLQQIRIPDPGQIENVRRLNRAGAQQHLAVGVGGRSLPALARHIVHPDGAALLDADLRGAGVGDDGEIGARVEDRREVALRRAPTPSVLDGELIAAKAFLIRAIEVVGQAVPSLGARLDHACVQGMA